MTIYYEENDIFLDVRHVSTLREFNSRNNVQWVRGINDWGYTTHYRSNSPLPAYTVAIKKIPLNFLYPLPWSGKSNQLLIVIHRTPKNFVKIRRKHFGFSCVRTDGWR